MDSQNLDLDKMNELYQQFVAETIKNNAVWMLMNGDQLATLETEGNDGALEIPLWASKASAASCEVLEWESFSPAALTISQFMDFCMDEFIGENALAAFNTATDTEFSVPFPKLRKDWIEEAEKKNPQILESPDSKEDSSRIRENYETWLSTIVHNGAAWFLTGDEGLVMLSLHRDISVPDSDSKLSSLQETVSEHKDALPVFASLEDAVADRKDEWYNCNTVPMPLPLLLNTIFPDMKSDNLFIFVPCEQDDGEFILPPELAIEDFKEECRKQDVDLDEMEELLQKMGLVDENGYANDIDDVYSDFIDCIVKNHELWLLHQRNFPENLSVADDEDGVTRLLIWNNQIAAESDCKSDWFNCVTETITPEEFLDEWAPGLEMDGLEILLALGQDRSIPISLSEFTQDLSDAMDRVNEDAKILPFRPRNSGNRLN